jgi:TolB protein
MILTHELAHIKRHDYLINLIQNVLMVIFFFHPLFHLLSRNLAKEREHICDDWVIDVTEQRGVYAECIVGLLEKALHKPVNIPVVIAMAERKRDIPGRIGMIVDRSRKLSTRLSRKALVVMLIIGCLSLPVIGGVELVRFAMAKPAPSEGWIIFSKSGQGKDGIWVMDADGKNEKQLTYGINDGSSVWSPDGRQIAFFRYTDDPNLRDIYIMDADGSDIKRLTEGPENDVNPTWSPDGKRIVFERSIWDKKDNNWEMKSWAFCVMDSNGSNIRILVEQPAKRDPNWGLRGGGDPELSPDGQKIAYYYWAVDRPALHVMDADGKNPKMLHRWGADAGIDWSPDGSKIAFASCQDSWMTWQSNDIYVINADGTDLKILTKPGPPWYSGIAWSPDGARIAFCSDLDKPGGTYDIYVMNADGSNVQRLTNTPEYEWVSDWTASSYAVEPAGKLKSTWGKIKERMGY